jgi:hypothetical protein
VFGIRWRSAGKGKASRHPRSKQISVWTYRRTHPQVLRNAFVGHSYDRARDRVYYCLLFLGSHSGHCQRRLRRGGLRRISPSCRSFCVILSGGAERYFSSCGDFFFRCCFFRCCVGCVACGDCGGCGWKPPQAQPQLQPQPAPHPAASLSFWESGGVPAFSLSKT